MMIRTKAYPRVGLIGNPSDGYFGKTIAFTFGNFCAETTLYETPDLEILPYTRDHSRFQSIRQLVSDVRAFGYYGGIRLLKAAIRRFHDYCEQRGLPLHGRNFTIRYSTDIPHLVGLAGSSAIITSCMRALATFYGVRIPKPEMANLILAVETEELALSAGLQDRVAQVYQGLVYMDFDRALMESQGHGGYVPMNPDVLPPLYVAYRSDLSEGSEIFHNNIRERFRAGDPEVLDAMTFWAGLAVEVKAMLEQGRGREIGPLLDANFDRRARLYRLSAGNLRMVHEARAAGASAKFTGSGGAIVGTYPDERVFAALRERLEAINVVVVRPVIVPASGDEAP